MKNYQNTLRFKHMVARLQGQSSYRLEAALMQEIAKGRRWRIDAVATAIEQSGADRWRMDSMAIFNSLGMHGRLFGIDRLTQTFKLKSKEGEHDACATQLLAAFDMAVIHGHYRVADYCASRGASPAYMIDSRIHPRAMAVAIDAGDTRKINYLLDKGASASYHLSGAIATGSLEMVKLFVEKGAEINGKFRDTPALVTALQYRHHDIFDYLVSKGGDVASCANAALYQSLHSGAPVIEKLIALGAKPDAELLKHALGANKVDIAEIFAAHGAAVTADTLMVAISSGGDVTAKADFCHRHGVDAAAALSALESQAYKPYGHDQQVVKMRAYVEAQAQPKAAHTKKPQGPKA